MNSLEKTNMTKLSKAHRGLRRPVLFMLAGFFFASFAGETATRFQSSASLASAAERTDDTPLARGRMKRLVIQPETLKFDKIPARMSENATVTVGNPNSVDAQIRSIRPHGADFKLASNQCPGSLAPAAQCTLEVTFLPRTRGRKTGHLVIADSASTDTQKVPLDGEAGTPTPAPSGSPSITATPTSSSTPTFTPTPAPPQAGDVLIAGGTGSGDSLTSAELYDPATGTFAPTHNMNTARAEHFAMLLETGDVLVACGDQLSAHNGGQFEMSADLYSTDTGKFSLTHDALNPCAAAAVASLNDGEVLVAGGGSGPALIPTPMQTPGPGAKLIPPYDVAAPQIYDPAKDQWHSAGNLVTGGTLLNSATTLADGTVLVAGGSDDPYFVGVQSGAQIYSPMSGMFTATGSMNSPRAAHTATLLSIGKVLIAGGVDDTGAVLNGAELFDPVAGKFTLTGTMTTARGGHRATLLGNGKVLLTGGIDATGTPLATAELYDPIAGTFSAAATMSAARYNHVAVLLGDGTVLVAGGTGSSFALSSAEVYDPVMNVFQPVGAMTTPRTQAAGVLLK